jgi:sialate O-acetylesterase
MSTSTLLLVLCVVFLGLDALQLNGIFSSNMVLQHDLPISVWGTSAGSNVVVTLAGATGQSQVVNGRFKVDLPKMTPGGPHIMLVKDTTGKSVQLTNLLIGDVYLCSGQSNMAWNTLRTWNPQPEIEDSDNYPTLRYYTVSGYDRIFLMSIASRNLIQ